MYIAVEYEGSRDGSRVRRKQERNETEFGRHHRRNFKEAMYIAVEIGKKPKRKPGD